MGSLKDPLRAADAARLGLAEKEAQALARRESRRITGADRFVPHTTAAFDRERGVRVLEVSVPSSDVELIWVRFAPGPLTTAAPALHFAEIAPGAEAVLRVDLPATDSLSQLPFIRTFAHCGQYGSWASADLEVAGRRADHLLIRQIAPPEVDGDVDMASSPRDRT